MKALILPDRHASIHFDEESRSDAIASVTIETEDESWGEFLTLEEVAAIHFWTGRLLEERLSG